MDEAAAALGASKALAEGLAAQLAASKQQAEELQARIAALGAEGAASRADAAVRSLEALMAEASALADRIGKAQAQVQAIAQTSLPTATPTDPPSVSGASGVPPLVRRLAERIPIWQRGEPARAFAYSEEDGSELALRSGTNPEAKSGLTFEYRSRFVMDHVESHLAGRIRAEGGPRNVTLVINKKPCPGFKGCDATLPDILPVGTSVTIYVKSGEGTAHYKTYEGTGRGIA